MHLDPNPHLKTSSDFFFFFLLFFISKSLLDCAQLTLHTFSLPVFMEKAQVSADTLEDLKEI